MSSLLPSPPLLPALRSSQSHFVSRHAIRLQLKNNSLLHPPRQPCRLVNQPSRTRPPVCAVVGFPELAPTAAIVYGGLLLGGGLLAYTRTTSKGSLFGGLIGGALLGLVFQLLMSPETKEVGDAIGFGTALLFVAVFGIRLAATKKIFPGVPLLLLSIIASTIFAGAYFQDKVQ